MARPSRVALALGSGGARGYAHIGVIAELEARGFEIVTVAGSNGTLPLAQVEALTRAGRMRPAGQAARDGSSRSQGSAKRSR